MRQTQTHRVGQVKLSPDRAANPNDGGTIGEELVHAVRSAEQGLVAGLLASVVECVSGQHHWL